MQAREPHLHHVGDLTRGLRGLGTRLERVLLALRLHQFGLQHPVHAHAPITSSARDIGKNWLSAP